MNIPISELHKGAQEGSAQSVCWKSRPFPDYLGDPLLNVARVERIIRWAGFSALTVTDDEGELPDYRTTDMRVKGINPDGAAVGVADTSSATPKLATGSVLYDSGPPAAPHYVRPVACVALDRAKISSKISDLKGERQLPEDRILPKVLSGALCDGITDAAKKNLLQGDEIETVFALASTVLTMLALTIPVNPTLHGPEKPLAAGWLLAVVAALQGIDHMNYWSANQLAKMQGAEAVEYITFADRRWSTSPSSFQHDRFIASALMARARRMVVPAQK